MVKKKIPVQGFGLFGRKRYAHALPVVKLQVEQAHQGTTPLSVNCSRSGVARGHYHQFIVGDQTRHRADTLVSRRSPPTDNANPITLHIHKDTRQEGGCAIIVTPPLMLWGKCFPSCGVHEQKNTVMNASMSREESFQGLMYGGTRCCSCL